MEKGLKITAITLFILIMGFFVFQAWLGHKVASVIEQKGSELDGGIYNVTVDNASVNIFARSVTIDGIRFKPDHSRIDEADPQEMILDFSIDGVFASGLNMKMLRGKAPFKLKMLRIDRPDISADLYSGAKHTGDDTTAVKKKNQGFQWPTRRLIINEGTVILRQHSADGAAYTEANDINVDLRENGRAGASPGIAGLLAGGVGISSVIMTNKDSSVDTIIDSIRVDMGAGRVDIAGVTVTPRWDKAEFVYRNSRHRDWTHLWARDISVHGLDVNAAALGGTAGDEDKKMHVTVDSLYIGSGLVESYKDRNAYQPYWVRKLIYESVSRLPFHLTVGKAVVEGLNAAYSELPKGGSAPGYINFTDLSGTVTGLSNVPSASQPYWTLAAHGFIYGAAALSATFSFPKSEATNHWEVSGSLGRLDLRNLNQTVTPLAKAEVETGQVDRMTFRISGNSRTASVDMELLYHDLKVDLVKLKDNNEVKERRFLSWIANEFIIKDSNPSPDGDLRRGTGSAERELDRSQFNFLWKTLVQGIKESAGL